MKSHYWIKLYHEILDDPKLGPMPDHLWRRCIELFLMAGEEQDAGKLPPVEAIAWRLRTTTDAISAELESLARLGIVNESSGGWIVTNFEARQSPSPVAERVRNYRQRTKVSPAPPSKEEEKKEETDIDTDTYCNATSLQETLHKALQNVTFRYNPGKTRPETDNEASERVLGVLSEWYALTGCTPKDSERVDHYFKPVNELLIRLAWDDDKALGMLRDERQRMLDEGMTPKRASAVMPGIFATLDGRQPTGHRVNGKATEKPRNMQEIDYLMSVIRGEETNGK